jgi:large subunit ribosomal protein L23
MALFGIGNKKQEKPKKEANKAEKPVAVEEKKEKSTKPAAVAVTQAGTVSGGLDLSQVLVRPHVTEKASDLSGKNVYAFDVHSRANKMDVRRAIEGLYKVKPIKVAIINEHGKQSKNYRTGRVQMKKRANKKALVYLKKGDKIEFV